MPAESEATQLDVPGDPAVVATELIDGDFPLRVSRIATNEAPHDYLLRTYGDRSNPEHALPESLELFKTAEGINGAVVALWAGGAWDLLVAVADGGSYLKTFRTPIAPENDLESLQQKLGATTTVRLKVEQNQLLSVV